MCRNGQYTEHGIKALDGFGSEYYRLGADFVVRADQSLGLLGVLTEPTSVVAKAWDHTERIGRRAHWEPRRVLVTGRRSSRAARRAARRAAAAWRCTCSIA